MKVYSNFRRTNDSAKCGWVQVLSLSVLATQTYQSAAFSTFSGQSSSHAFIRSATKKCRSNCGPLNARHDKVDAKLVRVSSAEEDTPIPFVDLSTPGEDFIECFADSLAYVNGVEYTIGCPCDTAVALCVAGKDGELDDEDQLTPVELDDPLMDELFSVAEGIVEEEFGEELVLMRTPQTLTLVGELDVDKDDDDDIDEDDLSDEEEEVEILLSFEHTDDMEVHLVRLLDPVLLVGKQDPENPLRRLLLSPRESDEIMPILEELFLQAQEEESD